MTLSILLSASACVRDPLRPASPGKQGQQDADGKSAKKVDNDSGGSIDDFGPLGSAARPVLDPEDYVQIVVELAFVDGREPSKEAANHLEGILESVAKKPVRINSHSMPTGDGSYSSDEILQLSRGRATSSSGDTVSIWIAYLDGEFSENRNALGVALAATVAAIFPDRIGTVGSVLNPVGVEKAVLVHEVGHVLALINIGYQSHIDHEDPEHPHHSKNDESVMHWAVEDISVANVFSGGPPSSFDEADLADLEMLRSS